MSTRKTKSKVRLIKRWFKANRRKRTMFTIEPPWLEKRYTGDILRNWEWYKEQCLFYQKAMDDKHHQWWPGVKQAVDDLIVYGSASVRYEE